MASILDLPPELVGNIFSRVPITCLRAVRSTCKSWNSLSEKWITGSLVLYKKKKKKWIVRERAARQQFVGFMSMDNTLWSVRFDLRGIGGTEDEVVEQSIKQVALFDYVEITNVVQVEGLVLLVTKDSLILWNPYLQQQRWIEPPRISGSREYVIGYDNNGNHKILRLCMEGVLREIYHVRSDMWSPVDLDHTLYSEWEFRPLQSATLKGNSYFFASKFLEEDREGAQFEACLLCFDFTREKFGHRPLDIPFRFHYIDGDTVLLSVVSRERLAILHENKNFDDLTIWVTNKIDPNAVSWTFFSLMNNNRTLQNPFRLYQAGSFFIDEEKEVAVVVDMSKTSSCTGRERAPTAHIIRDSGCFKSLTIGDITPPTPYYFPAPCVSPYLPSLVQIEHKRKRKRKRKRKTHV